MTFIKHALITFVLIFLAIGAIGPYFDEVCVEGQLSQVQADAINALPWRKCPSYREGECEANFEDRIIIRECSEASRSTFMWYKDVSKWWRRL